jgi:hypothetical protein
VHSALNSAAKQEILASPDAKGSYYAMVGQSSQVRDSGNIWEISGRFQRTIGIIQGISCQKIQTAVK